MVIFHSQVSLPESNTPDADTKCYLHTVENHGHDSGSDKIGGTDSIYKALISGNIPTEYGQTYGTNVPPSNGSWVISIE